METRSDNRNKIIGIILGVAVVLCGFAYLMSRTSSSTPTAPTSTATSTTTASTSTTDSANTVVTISPTTTTRVGGYTITPISVSAGSGIAAPAYQKSITCPAAMPQADCSSIQTQYAKVVAKLGADNKDFTSLLLLGMLRKQIGDYSGAAQVWTYLTKVYPASAVAYDNLGDLYANFMKEYAKAEQNWLASIQIKSGDPTPYRNLFALYTTTSFKPSASAPADILKKGIIANPTATDLQVLLARYYKTQGDAADASATYAAAIANAQSQGNSALAAQLQAEAVGR